MNLIDLYASPSTADGTADVGNGDIQGVNADVSEAQQSQVDSEYTARKRASIRAQIDVLKQKKANLEAQNVELHSGMKDIPDEEVLRIGEQLGVPDVAESWLGARTARRNRIDAVAESQKTRSSIDKENALADSEQKNAAVTQLNELAESWATEANDYGKKAKRVSLEKAIENFNRRYPQDAIDAEKFEADYGGTARISGSAAPSAQGVPSGFDLPERPSGLSNEQDAEWDRLEHSALLSDHRGETDKRDADVAELKKIIAKRKDASDASATERSRMISDKVKAIKENEMQAKDTAHPGRAARAKNVLNGFYANGKMVPGLYDQYKTLTGKAYGN